MPSVISGVSSSSLLQSLTDSLEEINRHVFRASELKSATSDLKRQIFVERITIENALKMAKSAIELEEKMKDPGFKKAYEAHERMFAVSSTHLEKASGESSRLDAALPTFQRGPRHSDDECEMAIQQSFDGLREDREAFLSVIHGQLSSNAVLRRHFLLSLKKLDGRRYLPALDPKSSWKHEGFTSHSQ